jgi:hypothetical protein
MLKSIHWRQHFAYALAAAVAYCIPVIVLLANPSFSLIWLLYLGNALFLIAIVGHLFLFNRQRSGDAHSMAMMTASMITAVMGILIAFVLCWILVVSMVPGLFHAGVADKTLARAPASTIGEKTHGLLFMIFMSVSVGNFVVGLFASIIFPFTLKGNQTVE